MSGNSSSMRNNQSFLAHCSPLLSGVINSHTPDVDYICLEKLSYGCKPIM